MRSIKAKLAIVYTVSATLTLAALLALGFLLLRNHLIAGLDFLNARQFEDVRAALGQDPVHLDPVEIDARIRATTERSSVYFFVSVHDAKSRVLFYSRNLNGVEIPDIPGQHAFSVEVPGIGPLRVGEFAVPPVEVMVATSLTPVATMMEGYVEISLALLAVMSVLGVLVGVGVAEVMLRPLRMIREAAERIGRGNYSARIAVDDVKDEVADLARLLNDMFARIEGAFEQTRRFAADASHELKTPLSMLRLHAERMLSRDALPPDQEDAILGQLEEIDRLNRVIEGLLFLSRAEAKAVALDRRARDPAKFLDGFAQDAVVLVEHRGARMALDVQGEGTAVFDDKWIRQVLLNLLANALAVSPPQGLITITSRLSPRAWRVAVRDQGCGLSDEQRAVMFDRFIRFGHEGQDDRGSGLGLAICRGIIELHQGTIFAEPGADGRGLTVGFDIPLEAA